MVPTTRIWGASQRMYYLANQLVTSGFGVTVFSGYYGLFKHHGKPLDFEHIPITIKPNFVQSHQENLAIKSIGQFTKPQRIGIRSYVVNRFVKPLYRKMELCFFNDYGAVGLFVSLWNRRAFRVIDSEIRSHNSKVIIFSGPYFTCFRLAPKIKKMHLTLRLYLITVTHGIY